MTSHHDIGHAGGADAASRTSRPPRTLIDDPALVIKSLPGSPIAERYRQLRRRLDQRTADCPVHRQVTVITSAMRGEGKTTTALNLALAFAEDRQLRTLLVDADLRRPSVSRFVVRKPTIGLMEVLSGESSLDDALIVLSDTRLQVLASGARSSAPLTLLQTTRLGALIIELRQRFDRVIIDTPPTIPFSDAACLVSHADRALIVVRADRTTNPIVRRAKESLSGARDLGVVLNGVSSTATDRYYDHYAAVASS